ncbi:MAG: hypothetical protein ACOCXT_04680 [Candidatus Dojkabacteria bacterium]
MKLSTLESLLGLPFEKRKFATLGLGALLRDFNNSPETQSSDNIPSLFALNHVLNSELFLESLHAGRSFTIEDTTIYNWPADIDRWLKHQFILPQLLSYTLSPFLCQHISHKGTPFAKFADQAPPPGLKQVFFRVMLGAVARKKVSNSINHHGGLMDPSTKILIPDYSIDTEIYRYTSLLCTPFSQNDLTSWPGIGFLLGYSEEMNSKAQKTWKVSNKDSPDQYWYKVRAILHTLLATNSSSAKTLTPFKDAGITNTQSGLAIHPIDALYRHIATTKPESNLEAIKLHIALLLYSQQKSNDSNEEEIGQKPKKKDKKKTNLHPRRSNQPRHPYGWPYPPLSRAIAGIHTEDINKFIETTRSCTTNRQIVEAAYNAAEDIIKKRRLAR